MVARFGNLTVKQIVDRLGIALKDNEREQLESYRQDVADVKDPSKLHIFDSPFGVACGPKIVRKVIEILQPYSDSMKVSVSVYELALPEQENPTHNPEEMK